jgi:hypothetical protein
LRRYKLVDSHSYCSLAGSWAICQPASACTMYLASERSDTNCSLHACLLRKPPSNSFGSVTNPHSEIGRVSEDRTRSLKGLELADQHNWGLAVLLRRGRDSATSRPGRSTCKTVSSCYALSENISCGILKATYRTTPVGSRRVEKIHWTWADMSCCTPLRSSWSIISHFARMLFLT